MIELLVRLACAGWRVIFPALPLWAVWVRFPPAAPRMLCLVRGTKDDAEDEARAHVAGVTLERQAPVFAEFMVSEVEG